MATQKGVLHPVSQYVPQFGRVKKVFLAYVHNPDQYETFIPPYPPEQLFDQNILHLVQQQRAQHESQQASKILAHRACVKRLAEYLKSVGVAVSYDQHWEGQQISNQLQHYEQQIADSDFVLLIITPSVKYYLENDAPKEEEILFTEHFLYNLMTIKKPDGTNFIPVFLNKRKDVSLVPTSLASSTSYELVEPFDIHRGDMYDLYALLTNQKLSETTPLGPYRLPSKPSPFGIPRRAPIAPQDGNLYKFLTQKHIPIPDPLYLSQHLAPEWKSIGNNLLSERELHDCEAKAGVSSNTREACYHMLCYWQSKDSHNATIARLAQAMWNANCYHLLKYLA